MRHMNRARCLFISIGFAASLFLPIVTRAEVEMLVPGFEVAKLPLTLPNINNVIYRPDGKLIAGAYNGNVYLLSDTDGDGLEDEAVLWWDSKGKTRGPLGIALTPPGYAHGNGVIIPSKGKVSLITDDNGDDVADTERIIAEGWPEGRQSVDAVAVAIHPEDHSVYFGIGTALYNNAYLLDDDGKAHFDINGELGTIQRISPDLKSRETICTGVRFSCALRFNEHGDLFATDQEGATWLPNGNPFDELLHIQTGRHYGFPPRHPRHLPGLIDEPSVVDYKPQHQSTCGLNFNVPVVEGGSIFGPEIWRNDALVIGESRGKLWRTKLVKRPEGYLAQTQLIACMNRLAIDGCVSPDGGFVICTHSGDPDWGTGPSGEGELFKLSYVARELPQPVVAWAQRPGEFRVAFDRALDPEYLKKLNASDELRVEWGDFVSAGDRHERMRPGYEVVRAQMAEQRNELKVERVLVAADRCSIILYTERLLQETRYAIQLPGIQVDKAIDVGIESAGVSVQFATGDAKWEGWLPHLDLRASRELTAGSVFHDQLWQLMAKGGELTINGNLDLRDMLRPSVQPGSVIDFEYPDEIVTLTIGSPDNEFSVSGDLLGEQQSSRAHTAHLVTFDFNEPEDVAFRLTAHLPPGKPIPSLTVRWSTNEDDRQRQLSTSRLKVPQNASGIEERLPDRQQSELSEFSWAKGRDIFHSERAQCSKCHGMKSSGYTIGPDLGNLVHRDTESIAHDIGQPSAAIHPDFVTYQITMTDGVTHIGTLQAVDGKSVIGTAAGIPVTVDPTEIAKVDPLPISIMPPGLDKVLGAADFGHLMKFLTHQGLDPAKMERSGAPEPRSLESVEKVLAGQTESERKPTKLKPLKLLLCTGPKDHGPGEHDYPLWRERWSRLLPLAESVTVDLADSWPTSEQFENADVAVFYSANPGWNLRTARDLTRFQERGGGLVIIHWAVHGGQIPVRFADHIGLSGIPTMRYRHGPLRLDFDSQDHPVTKGFGETASFVDESYWKMVGDPARIDLLASSEEERNRWPQLWTYEKGKSRVFVSIPGHYSWTFDDPLFRILLLRGICWTAREPADRLSELSTIGARVTD